MSILAGRPPRLVDDDDYDLDSSRIDLISPDDRNSMLEEDSPTDELEVIDDETGANR